MGEQGTSAPKHVTMRKRFTSREVKVGKGGSMSTTILAQAILAQGSTLHPQHPPHNLSLPRLHSFAQTGAFLCWTAWK